jgi:hypothetical protein
VTATATLAVTNTPVVTGPGAPAIPTLSGRGVLLLVLVLGGIAAALLVRARR